MSPADARAPDGPLDDRPARSVALVLGAGGAPGWAWTVGCLAALAEVGGWDGRSADLIVGTSAGSGVGALLRAGLSPLDQLAQYRGTALSAEGEAIIARAPAAANSGPADRSLGADDAPPPGETGDGPISPVLALRSLGHWPPRPGLAVAGLQRRGRQPLDDLARRLDAFSGRSWPAEPLWITALRLDNGRRVVFGRDGIDPGGVGRAVEASSAVPGCYAPVRIGEHDYLDGGAWSATNADLVAGLGFELAVVVAPLSVTTARLNWDGRRLRRAYHRSVLSREVDAVHRNGTDAVVLEPQPDDLALLSVAAGDLDDSRRRAIAELGRRRTTERLAADASLGALANALDGPSGAAA